MKLNVSDLMTDEVYSVRENESLKAASDLMDSLGVRHLPVLDADAELVGIISQRDLVGHGLEAEDEVGIEGREEILRSQKVSEVVRRDVETISPDESAVEAGLTLLENKFGCLPVTEGGTLVGILTESDYIRFVVNNAPTFPDEIPIESGRKVRPRDNVHGGSISALPGKLDGDRGAQGGIGFVRGRATGEDEDSAVPGGWEGSDDETSTGSDRSEEAWG